MSVKVWLTIVSRMVFAGALLFGAAGTLWWPAAWMFLLSLFTVGLWVSRWLATHDPELLAERMKPLFQPGQPRWDRIVLSVTSALLVGWLVLMGIDAVRFHESDIPLWLNVIGGAGLALGIWICASTFRANTFLSAVFKIQTERGHRVVSTGPYAIVRHPLYAGLLVVFPSVALLLGSQWGLAATPLLAGGVILRTADRHFKGPFSLSGTLSPAE